MADDFIRRKMRTPILVFVLRKVNFHSNGEDSHIEIDQTDCHKFHPHPKQALP